MDRQLFENFCRQEQWHHQPFSRSLSTEDADFALWQKWLVRKSLTSAELEQFPAVAVALYLGWQSYHSGQYQQALSLFLEAAEHGEPQFINVAIDAAIGICRIYTRVGHWHHARLWAVSALQQSRRANRLFDISRSFNALGDVLCRAGHTQLAHFCLICAANVLPHGSIHKARHLNNVATTLMRQQANLRAEAVLMNSLYLAKDTNDADSSWHALARLQWLYLDIAPTIQVTTRFASALPTKVVPIAKAYIEVALAIQALHQDETSKAYQALANAAEYTSSSLPIESAWFHYCAGEPVAEASANLLKLKCQAPLHLSTDSALDTNVLQAKLADQQFTWLLQSTPHISAQQLLIQRQYFFI